MSIRVVMYDRQVGTNSDPIIAKNNSSCKLIFRQKLKALRQWASKILLEAQYFSLHQPELWGHAHL